MKFGEGAMGDGSPSKIKIGVFDSGKGGLSVAKAIEAALPNEEVIFVDDQQHLPYGTKPPQEIIRYVLPILEDLIRQGCKVIVIACNTVTTTLIGQLRAKLPVPLVGIEPMVKPAASMTRTGIIAVCATPTTLSSQRYHWLKQEFAKGIRVLEPDCSDWTKLIEDNKLDHQKITQRIEEVCQKGADVIVLACTHYHWIEDIVKAIANGRAKVIQPEQPVINQLKRVLAQQP